MLLTLNSLHWENYNQAIVQSQKQVFDKFEIPITYTKANVRHDEWMDYICKNVEADVYFFVDADCVILNREIFDASLEYVLRITPFLGTAQASNHIHPYSHVFAAPAFFMITRDCYRALGSPSFCMNHRSDVAEEVSYVAEEKAWRIELSIQRALTMSQWRAFGDWGTMDFTESEHSSDQVFTTSINPDLIGMSLCFNGDVSKS